MTTNLTVARTSGGGSDIDWLTRPQEETFQANGGHLGDMSWSLSTDGTNGFTVVESDSSGCIVKTAGQTTTGTGPCTFVLMADASAT